ncbi:MAG: terminase small subunit [Methylorubrum rhodinum]|uniref:terminase small subunit n=1 Tax=Methylorubrum rhodinum TaxID=29428 RepID=UPI003BB1554A
MSGAAIEGRSVNRAELASLCGVSLPTVDSWVEKGCPYIERGSKGREWQFDSAAVIDWRIQRAVENAVSGYADESGAVTKEEADRRRAVANAITAEIGADEALHAVVARHDAESDVAAFCQVLKTGLSSAVSKIASRGCAITSAPEIAQMARDEINRAFEAARGELRARWAIGRDQGADDRGG